MSGLKNKIKAATLVDILRNRAEKQPHQKIYNFLVDGENEELSLTYSQLEQKAQAIAAYLQSVISPQDRVLLLYPAGLDYITAFFGCLYAGAIAIPAYPPRPNRSLHRIQNILQNAQTDLALTNTDTLQSLERQLDSTPELKKLRWITTNTIASHEGKNWQEPNVSQDSIAFLQYTSGSTAEPKGVKIAYQNLLHNLEAIHRCFRHSPQSKGVIWLPPYHDMGLIGGILQPLYGDFPVTLMSPLMFLQNPLRWLKAIARDQATTSGGPNFAYDLCVRKFKPEQLTGLDLSSWQVAFNGAEPINHETLNQFAEIFAPYGFDRSAFYPCYGMAEATLIISGGSKNSAVVTKTVQRKALEQNKIVSSDSSDSHPHTLVSCGQSLIDQKIAIANPETLVSCKPGEVGEIWVSGSSIARGYWEQPEITEATFNAYLQDTKVGPFLRTGDLGFLDRGELFFTGRLKDMIVIKGRNHYPQDIEKTVEETNSWIRPSGVASFSIDIQGEEKLIVLAEVERRYWTSNRSKAKANGNSASDLIEVKDLTQLIKREISKNHDLQVYTTLLLKPGSLPKTSSGKIQRHACRTDFLANSIEGLPL
ncbi:fatty acyl-AMP ligase [Waterburya agarophytonicola K14]|uniref:Fatty acyl-AMP ligase n=1 Tax=Waterburya agarophytonicola KI4 TaxID=2874699 RepID=A0A964BSQ7_9CYAN|nr:fatty acyl-AMP ligase [Waterburya agarophytonicola]MCC0178101.1 fatty acyl-AMP ligase [Waterburya agarophytonicola KI4]